MRKRIPKALRARCCPNRFETNLLDNDLKPFWTRVQNLENRARQPPKPLQAAPDLRGHKPKSENRLPVEEMKRKSVSTPRRSVKPSGREERRSAQANSRANYPCRGFCPLKRPGLTGARENLDDSQGLYDTSLKILCLLPAGLSLMRVWS